VSLWRARGASYRGWTRDWGSRTSCGAGF